MQFSRRRKEEPSSVEAERIALRETRLELEAAKKELAERVVAVREREAELRALVAEGSNGADTLILPATRSETDTVAERMRLLDQREALLDRREAELVGREGAAEKLALAGDAHSESGLETRLVEIEQREVALAARLTEIEYRERELSHNAETISLGPEEAERERLAVERLEALAAREAAVAAREEELAQRAQALDGTPGDDARSAALDERALRIAEREQELEQLIAAADPKREARLERRLAEIRDVERQFVRTQRELAERSDAIAERERAVERRERALEESGGDGGWSRVDVSELEARLRRLEDRGPGGFSSGLRRLQQGPPRQPPDER